MIPFDEDALIAAIELVNRSGAQRVEIGHTGDDEEEVTTFGEVNPAAFIPEPPDDVTWWAKATYRGAVLMVEQHHDPVAAAEQLARKILAGGLCKGCNRQIALSLAAVNPAKRCRWTREGAHWMPGCPGGRARLKERLAART